LGGNPPLKKRKLQSLPKKKEKKEKGGWGGIPPLEKRKLD
jgi:hypothetical protein